MFAASLVRSAFGFGEALVAVPLLALHIPLHVAAPMAVLMSITVAAMILLQDWHKIHLRSAGLLIASSVVGIPFGLLLLTRGNEQLVRMGLGVIIIGFSLYCLLGRRMIVLAREHLGWVIGCGFIAGVLGGAYGLNGPPLVIYGTMRRWSAQHFRATLQAYFFPASILGMAGYWAAGLWTPEVNRTYLVALPAVIPAVIVGRYLNHRMHGDRFYKYVYAGLLVIGITFFFQAIYLAG
jgi:uncharacterized membrane protein YfcA